jgi:hypothetical protein
MLSADTDGDGVSNVTGEILRQAKTQSKNTIAEMVTAQRRARSGLAADFAVVREILGAEGFVN